LAGYIKINVLACCPTMTSGTAPFAYARQIVRLKVTGNFSHRTVVPREVVRKDVKLP